MEIRSLGFRTDIALREYAGSEVVDRETHLVVRTPDNPTFWWGNFLLLAQPPADAAEGRHWMAEFEREFPQARHRTFGIDGKDVSLDQAGPLAALDCEAEISTVLTATSVHPPARPNERAQVRPLDGNDEWEQQVVLSGVGEEIGWDLEFCRARAAADRRLVEDGRGQWYGAFVDGRLLSSMGLFTASPGLARFQSVKTHPDARGQGLAGTLVHTVSRFGLDELGAHTLVMVADPDYLAIRIYRAVGFAASESQVGLQRRPDSRADD